VKYLVLLPLFLSCSQRIGRHPFSLISISNIVGGICSTKLGKPRCLEFRTHSLFSGYQMFMVLQVKVNPLIILYAGMRYEP